MVGASPKGNRGTAILQNLRRFGYQGKLFAVNPNYTEIEGVRCVPHLSALPEPVEFVACAVAAEATVEVLDQAAATGVKAGLVIAGGFGEGSGRGGAHAERLRSVAARSGMRICGPNCYGILNVHDNAAPYSGGIVEPLEPGGVGFIIQSGAVSHAVHDTAVGRGLGISYIVTSGNEAVVDLAEYVDWMVADPRTSVIALFIEGLRRPRRFADAAAKALRAGKPIIALKVGRGERGKRAALAHTGSVAGTDAAYEGFFRQCGVVRVEDIDEMRETILLFSSAARPRGRGVAIASISGGMISITSDLADATGLETPEPSAQTRRQLEETLPGFGIAANPLDTTGVLAERPEMLEGVTLAFLSDPGIHTFALAMNTPLGSGGQKTLYQTHARILAQTRPKTDKAIVCFSVPSGAVDPDMFRPLHDAGIPFLMGARESIRALHHWTLYGDRRRALLGERGRLGAGRFPERPSGAQKVLTERRAVGMLARYGLSFVAHETAGNADEAAAAADRLGYPVAVKVDSADIAHKTEIGGVRLGLRDAGEVRSAVREIMASAARLQPTASVDGVLVQRMAPKGVEVLLGVMRDPALGLQIVVGAGGTLVELMRAVSMRPVPISAADAQEMIDETPLATMLAGFRGQPAADRRALAEALVALSDVASDLGDSLEEIDLNPMLALPDETGVVGLDALVVFRS